MKKFTLVLALILSLQQLTFAVEGMWIPSLIEMFHSDMKTFGLKLSPEEIYATNKASLKDAIVQFNGGCTAEIVSDQGLLFTNHHCGFSAIQHHSSLEKDYLKNGFWAKNSSEELVCSWMYVTFVKEIREVTKEVFKGVTADMSAETRAKTMMTNIAKLESEAKTDSDIAVKIKEFSFGNQFFMLITQNYNDIRLVGTPPSAIGKYGGDTDNWVWPRHTGDFAVFRIYANKDNKPAKYSADNVPFKPAHFLPISMKPKKEGDFTMVYGFPGQTDQHYCATKLGFYIEQERPARIAMRQATMDLMKPAMNGSDEIRIKYASKQASIANAWKKWIGQIQGLEELYALHKRETWEEEYLAKTAEKPEWSKYKGALDGLNKLQMENLKYEFARAIFIEYYHTGPEFLKFAYDFNNLANNYKALIDDKKLEAEIKRLIEAAEGFFKNYDKNLDQAIFKSLTPMYIDYTDPSLQPAGFKDTWSKNGDKIFSKSIFMDLAKIKDLLSKFTDKSCAKIQKDPAFIMAAELSNVLSTKINPPYREFAIKEQGLMQTYVEGVLTMYPNRKTWADANSTLRIAYGKIEGSAPVDGMKYTHYSTMKGIMQKHNPQDPDFELTERFIELYKKGDWADYAQDGELWVCFTASNHTTGGNSGSPVIDGEGNFIGINFDRSWESTMSDFLFDASRCRNIVVDSRYILWVIEKYGEAGHLIKEMKLVR